MRPTKYTSSQSEWILTVTAYVNAVDKELKEKGFFFYFSSTKFFHTERNVTSHILGGDFKLRKQNRPK